MHEKNKKDTLSIINSQMKMIQERLNNMSYAEIWPQLKLQEEKLSKAIRELEK
jgi:DNA-binding Lrp family transcriptional regulator